MLKKKNVAMIMAAATAATSVAPVFAAETEADVVKRIKDIKSTTTLKKGEETDQLIKDLRFLLNEGTKFEVVTSGSTLSYYSTTTNATVDAQNPLYKIEKGDSVYAVFMDNGSGYKEVNSILEIENAINSLKSISGSIDSLKVRVLDKGYTIVDGKVSALNHKGQDIVTTSINSDITIVASSANNIELSVEDLYDGEYLTQTGFELYSAIINKNNLLDGEFLYTPIVSTAHTGNKIEVEEGANKGEETIKLTLTVKYLDSAKEDEVYHITIKGKDSADINELAKFLNGDDNLGASRLGGEDRFKTAVKIAKATSAANVNYDGEHIVLVNAESMIDGLTATPLACALNAPVLLTNKDAVQEDTLNYIKAIKKANTEVTIVGGKDVVSEAVVRELEKLGVKVDRVGGENRHATSVEVGIKMKSIPGVNIDNAFIVAANGEADAMSIAPVAGRTTAPIIVEGFDGMSTTANELLKDAKTLKKVDLIGGKVSEKTQELYAKSGDFVYGADRYDTNAKVVEKYYKQDRTNPAFKDGAKAIYVTKDGMTNSAQLVDALAVGTLAVEKEAAIILATDGLSTRQKEAVKSVATKTPKAEVKQIGGGVKFSTTVKQVAKILGFTK